MEQTNDISQALSALSENDSKELIKSLIQTALKSGKERNKLNPEETIQKLVEYRQLLNEKHEFKEGDIVTWKPNLKNRTTPNYNEPAIVLEVLESPLFDDSTETGSAYFREPLDIIIGIIAEGELISFYFDKRKFRPYVKNN